jgi:DNA primase large subunit
MPALLSVQNGTTSVLKGIEYAVSRGTKPVELRSKIDDLVKRYLPGLGTAEGVRRDLVSHHILRLAFAGTDDKRRWFLTQEVILFRLTTPLPTRVHTAGRV